MCECNILLRSLTSRYYILLQLVLLFFNRLFSGYPPRAILQYRVYLQLHSWITIIIIKKKILRNCIPYTICAQYYIHITRAPRTSTHIHRTCSSTYTSAGGRLHIIQQVGHDHIYFVLWSVDNSMCSIAVGCFSSGLFIIHLSWFIIIVMSLYYTKRRYLYIRLLFFNLIRSNSLCVYTKHKYREFDALAIGR